MILIVHILAALGGIVMSSLSLLSPSLSRIRFSYGLVMATIASGTAIVLREHLSIVSVCLSGLLYVGFTVSGLVAARRKLARQERTAE
ncbi:MAG TPA: hypothetical protein VFJ84_03090 [Candidatus Saccharimonadales bacterium]|nr:hypothetical protein [Candidatus Saccharimonadales bacterium]